MSYSYGGLDWDAYQVTAMDTEEGLTYMSSSLAEDSNLVENPEQKEVLALETAAEETGVAGASTGSGYGRARVQRQDRVSEAEETWQDDRWWKGRFVRKTYDINTWSADAQAALVFNADFARNGNYENSWPLVPGQVIAVDIYVSNAPEPGLIAMGFKLTYDSSKLEVVMVDSAVDADNWPQAPVLEIVTVAGDVDEVHMTGFRFEGLAGDNIRLGSVTFRCVGEGNSVLRLHTRGETIYGFVLDCDEETQDCYLLLEDDPDEELLEQLLAQLILDGDIGEGVLLATIRPPVVGDVNGDELVDLADAIMSLKIVAGIQPDYYIHTNANVSGDDAIGLAEAIYILQHISGLRQP